MVTLRNMASVWVRIAVVAFCLILISQNSKSQDVPSAAQNQQDQADETAVSQIEETTPEVPEIVLAETTDSKATAVQPEATKTADSKTDVTETTPSKTTVDPKEVPVTEASPPDATVDQKAVPETAATTASEHTSNASAQSGDSTAPATTEPPTWLEDYSQAMAQAKAEKKLMLIHFFRPSDQQRSEAQAAGDSVVNVEKAFNQPSIREKLSGYVLAKLPIDSQITVKGQTIRLLDHGAFSELHKGPGLAVIDLAHEQAEYWGYVVSTLPFTPGKYYRFRPSQVETLVGLPEGTLTQRSMIFAVRIHPEHPASTNGQYNPVLLSEATSHSDYQAQIHVQGHQGWGERFQRILGKLLGRGESGMPVEVVAESWPDQDLMDSCVDCVNSWRQSPGHWEAVSARQASYGYDIREGSNGIWYATGIFREAH
jgi:hypothetical protein